ncbi:MAG TPA: arginine deiminase family protein [Terriglobales bacterium]|nr:arginine deiminase family protein [Terriglobales bacterium]
MVAPLKRVLICAPESVGWENGQNWSELGYGHAPDFARAQAQHAALRQELEAVGAEVLSLPKRDGLSLDAVYVHDASFITSFGAVLLAMGKTGRRAEPSSHREFYQSLGIAVLGEIRAPGTVESGDLVWLDDRTVLAGHSFRTNADGIEQLHNLLAPHGITVLSAPLPYAAGPACCLHLMSLMSVLDEHTMLVDLPLLAVETVELLREGGFDFISIDASERDSLACNVLALGNRRLLAIEQNQRSNQRLLEAGFDVRTFPGDEIGINGGGGPTCLTRPILRG